MAVAPNCTSEEAKEVGRCSGQSHLGISKSKSSWQFTFYRCAHPLLPNSQSLPHHKTGAIRGLQQRWSNFKVHSLHVIMLHWITPYITEMQTHIGKGILHFLYYYVASPLRILFLGSIVQRLPLASLTHDLRWSGKEIIEKVWTTSNILTQMKSVRKMSEVMMQRAPSPMAALEFLVYSSSVALLLVDT